jgi:uncharacterized protein (DUF2147 family)
MRLLFLSLVLTGFSLFPSSSLHAQTDPADAILGYWMTVDNMLKVHVYKENGEFRATIVWFQDAHYKCKMNDCTDENNPDPALRSRKIIGMQVLSGLTYNAAAKEWVGGKIYDSNSGSTYDSVVTMSDINVLTVRGYYLFEWLGESLHFYRVTQ